MPQKILIIEDDIDVAEMLDAYFRVHGYEVMTANWGEEGVEQAQRWAPDLIILDIRLPDIDGFVVAERLRAAHRTAMTPILFLTEKRQRMDRIKGLELGADDYITKPFDVQELRLRVRNALRRATQGALTNPITDLPEGELADERLSALLEKPENQSLLLIRLDHLEAFRETYGFVASDDVLRAVCLMIQSLVHRQGKADDFLGHLGPADILVITGEINPRPLAETIRARLPQAIDLFYPLGSREHTTPTGRRLNVRLGALTAEQIAAAGTLAGLKENLVHSLG